MVRPHTRYACHHRQSPPWHAQQDASVETRAQLLLLNARALWVLWMPEFTQSEAPCKHAQAAAGCPCKHAQAVPFWPHDMAMTMRHLAAYITG